MQADSSTVRVTCAAVLNADAFCHDEQIKASDAQRDIRHAVCFWLCSQ